MSYEDDERPAPGIELEEGDCAIIFRKNGDVVSCLLEGDEDVELGSPSMMVAVIMYLLSEDERYQELEAEFLDFLETEEASTTTATPGVLH